MLADLGNNVTVFGLRELLIGDSFYGCPFMSAAGEYSERPGLVFQEAAMHKRLMTAYFEELARAAGFDQPGKIAQQINLLHEGAIAVAHISGDSEAARTAKAVAELVLDQEATAGAG